jgi:hypothetical protein
MELNGRFGLWNTCGLGKATVFPLSYSQLLRDSLQCRFKMRCNLFQGRPVPVPGALMLWGAIGVTLSTLLTAPTRGWWEMYEIGGNFVLPKSA